MGLNMKFLTIKNRKTNRIIATFLVPNDMAISDWAYKKVEGQGYVMEKNDFPIPQIDNTVQLEEELFELFK